MFLMNVWVSAIPCNKGHYFPCRWKTIFVKYGPKALNSLADLPQVGGTTVDINCEIFVLNNFALDAPQPKVKLHLTADFVIYCSFQGISGALHADRVIRPKQ